MLGGESKAGERLVTLSAPPAAWADFNQPGIRVSPLPLEDIFIALARSPVGGI